MIKNNHLIHLRLFKVLDGYKRQEPAFYEHVSEIIEGKYYPEDEILYEQDEIIKDVYFLSSGTMTAYTYTDSGEKQLLDIYRANEIVTGESFTFQKGSAYYLMVCSGSYLLSLNLDQVKEIYQKFPGTEELARMVIVSRESKELRRSLLLNEPGIQMVEEFYKVYPELLEPGKVLRDTDIASYLLLAEGTLRSLRNRLLHDGLLKVDKPAKI